MIPHYWSQPLLLNPYLHPLFLQNPSFFPSEVPQPHLLPTHPSLKHENRIEKGEKIQICREDLEKEVFNSSKKTWT